MSTLLLTLANGPERREEAGMRLAVLGLGEAGSIYAGGLSGRGAEVTAFDPRATATPTGVTRTTSPAAAVAPAELVLSLVGASASEEVAAAALPHLSDGVVYADMNTCSPGVKAAIADAAARHGALFADVAILAPVSRFAVLTPLLASGAGSRRLEELLRPFGIPIERIDGPAGTAAGLKLLRSVFMKGLAALVFESLAAAERHDATEWMRQQIAQELGPNGEPLVERLVTGTRTHAVRREHEMRAARDHLVALETPTWITDATITWLRRLAESERLPAADT
jgi:3-hydroxyisobutyrate dehydrogenase-like beta-hydroxyacid dehydrogenase